MTIMRQESGNKYGGRLLESGQVVSATVGLLLGGANFIGFRSKLSESAKPGAPALPTWKRPLWQFLAWFDLLAFPVVGYFIPTIFKGL